MLLVFSFYTEDPVIVGGSINVFLLPDLYLSAGSKAALLAQRWDAVLGDNKFTSFADTGTLLGGQMIVPITSWDAALEQIKARSVFCTVFLEDSSVCPSTQ